MRRKACLLLAGILALSLIPLPVFPEGTEELSWKVTRVTAADSELIRFAYPSFELNGTALSSQELNGALLRDAEIARHLASAGQAAAGGQGLLVDYTLYTADPHSRILSLVLFAKGRMPVGRPSQKWYPFVFDLLGGERMTFESLFTDAEGARERIEAYISEELEEELSEYMENRALFPVPYDRFALCGEGLLFFYDYSQLSFLSGYSGQIMIPWEVLEDFACPADPDWRSALGIRTRPDGATGNTILEAAAGGGIPGLPLRLGDPMGALLDSFRAAADPGYWYGGASFETEDARLYRTLLLTDEKGETLTGIYSARVNMAGIITGRTALEECRKCLGAPSETLEIDENSRYAPLFGAGVLDFYPAGEHLLILYAGEDLILDGVLLV